MESEPRSNLTGLHVVCFESRRAKELAELIRRYGGEPIVAPSMREIPLAENHAALDLLPALEASQFEMLILMTGVGTKSLYEVLSTQFDQERIFAALRKVQLVARGPKPVGVLRDWGLRAAFTVPEPNTWREIVATLDGAVALRGKRIAIQEYGIANPELIRALESRGAAVTPIPIYRWALPEDLAPLRAAISSILQGHVDVALFTNGAQVDHLFQVAAFDNGNEMLRQAFKKLVVGSVGPVCTQVLRQFGLAPDLEPSHPKMGSLVAELAVSARAILSAKSKP